jgi:hypothetical protein
VDGDGLADLLLGNSRSDSPDENAGSASLIYGSASRLSGELSEDRDAIFRGDRLYDYAGDSVALVGDTDGDGYDDLLVGAVGYGSDDIGTAFLVLGSGTRFSGELVLVANAGTSITGKDAEDHLAEEVAEAGDHDGDGFGDLVLGAPGSEEGPTDKDWGDGAVHFFLGPLAPGALSVSDADITLIGDSYIAELGSLLGTGDLTGSGGGDLIMTADLGQTLYVIQGGGL